MPYSLTSLTTALFRLSQAAIVCLGLVFSAGNAAAADAACPAIPGISKTGCTTPLKPVDFLKDAKETFWYDTDGVNPGVAGCHIGVKGLKDRTPNGRSFGEACQSDVILIESNPAANVIHAHSGDVGSPYLVNCNEWCKAAPQRKKSGSCKVVNGPAPCAKSARCECK